MATAPERTSVKAAFYVVVHVCYTDLVYTDWV